MIEDHPPEDHHSYLLSRHRFVTLIIATILVSLTLVVVAMALYASSGAAQVDLSRPGYEGVREQVNEGDPSFEGFSATGPINATSLERFEELFSERAKSATEADVFGAEAISNKTLGISSKE